MVTFGSTGGHVGECASCVLVDGIPILRAKTGDEAKVGIARGIAVG